MWEDVDVAERDPIVPFDAFDLNDVIADIHAIREQNPQRYEFEQLTAIVYENAESGTCVGYKDIAEDEFWVRGHMPGMPVMPGVMMCEAAAQLCSYYGTKLSYINDGQVLGFGGLEEVRFRETVSPGARLVVMAEKIKHRQGVMIVSRFQEYVDRTLVCEGIIKGISLPYDALKPASA